MSKKLLGADISPKCEYCKKGTTSPDGKHVLCEKMGILELDFSCKKFEYDALKRTPRKITISQEFSKEDFEI